MSLHVPAGACIPVASASPIHVFPIRVLKHCGAHKHIYIYTYAHDPKNLRTPQLAGFARQLGCKNCIKHKNAFSTLLLSSTVCIFTHGCITRKFFIENPGMQGGIQNTGWNKINNILFMIVGYSPTLFFTPQLAGKARQLGCPKIVLDHVRVYIYIYINYVCAHHNA